MIYKATEISDIDFKDRKEIEIRIDTKQYKKLFRKLIFFNVIYLYPCDDTLMETLELAGALREAGVKVSINGSPPTLEPKIAKNTKLILNIGIKKWGKELTWNVDSTVGINYSDTENKSYLIGKDFPISDPRTGIIGYFLNKNAVVIFTQLKEESAIGELIGKTENENLLIRPNRWFTDLSVLEIKEKNKDNILAESKEIFCRPLGSAYIPVTRQELFNVLIKFKMRSSGFSIDCYKTLGWLD
uniref:Uncharacterized protein n=2 Tax=Acidianus brierleyi TaxID=41673 RepID=A0A2U9IGP8_9CREN